MKNFDLKRAFKSSLALIIILLIVNSVIYKGFTCASIVSAVVGGLVGGFVGGMIMGFFKKYTKGEK